MPVTISREYEEFLREEKLVRKLSIYESACNRSEKIFPFKPWKDAERQFREAIEFSHLRITPKGAFSLAILFSLLTILVPASILVAFNSLSVSAALFIIAIAFLVAYFLFDYPIHQTTVFRIKASSEMVLSIVYMTISMRISPNMEKAIEFTTRNLKGPLSRDLRELLWNMYTRKYSSTDEALEAFVNKWKKDNKEFTEALYAIKNSSAESLEKREKMLDEAVEIILEGTKERMRHYAQDLKSPMAVLNALGILLPVIGLVFFPVISMFLPDLIKPTFLIVGYDVFLPLGIYFLMKNYLEKRPYTFHQPDISRHPTFAKSKFLEKPFIPFIISIPLIAGGLYGLSLTEGLFSFKQLVLSMVITLGISLGVISYSFLSVYRKLKLRKEVVEIESEFAEALYQLGTQLSRGMPLEKALSKVAGDIKTLRISKFFERILHNIQNLGMTFEQAIFDKKLGAINFYPSSLIETIMKMVVETSKRGMASVSGAMLTVSSYLKDMHSVNEELQSLLEETTSTMKMQANLLAPIAAGVVVAMAALMTQLLVSLGEAFEKIYSQLGDFGPAGTVGSGAISSIVNLNAIIPIHGFQLIVGVYVVEIVSMLAIFLSMIVNGEESLIRRYTIAKMLAMSIVVYFAVLLISYLMFTAVMPIEKIIV